jgi:hypothetical protein
LVAVGMLLARGVPHPPMIGGGYQAGGNLVLYPVVAPALILRAR